MIGTSAQLYLPRKKTTLSGTVAKENDGYIWLDTENGQIKVPKNHKRLTFAHNTLTPKKADIKFDINKRFQFIMDLTKMVKSKQLNGLVITGSGGLGKSHTVLKEVEGIEYILIKGYSSPRALFDTLKEHRSSIIIFDDCDSILKDRNAVNLLKGAIDTGRRLVNWNTASGDSDGFVFKGSILFISNMPLTEIPQPILSRCLFVDVTMTTTEKMLRIKTILHLIDDNLTPDLKDEVYNLMDEYKNQITDLNIRTYLKVAAIRNSGLENWKDLALYTILTKI